MIVQLDIVSHRNTKYAVTVSITEEERVNVVLTEFLSQTSLINRQFYSKRFDYVLTFDQVLLWEVRKVSLWEAEDSLIDWTSFHFIRIRKTHMSDRMFQNLRNTFFTQERTFVFL